MYAVGYTLYIWGIVVIRLPLSVRMAAELGIVITTVASDFGANEIRE